jgi:hypothetical protein
MPTTSAPSLSHPHDLEPPIPVPVLHRNFRLHVFQFLSQPIHIIPTRTITLSHHLPQTTQQKFETHPIQHPPLQGGQPLSLIYFPTVTHLGGKRQHPPQPSPLQGLPTYTRTIHTLLISLMDTLQPKYFLQPLHGPKLHTIHIYRLCYPSTRKQYPASPL